MKISILGAEYALIERKRHKDPQLSDKDGYSSVGTFQMLTVYGGHT